MNREIVESLTDYQREAICERLADEAVRSLSDREVRNLLTDIYYDDFELMEPGKLAETIQEYELNITDILNR